MTAALISFVWACSKKDNIHDPGVEPIVVLEDNETVEAAPVEAEEEAAPEEPAVALTEDQAQGLELINGSDCRTCHKDTERMIGPSYQEIAEKYTDSDKDMLVQKIVDGGAGNWGDIPMTPHPTLDEGDIGLMMEYVMSFKE